MKSFLFAFFLTLFTAAAYAGIEIIPSGSFVVNMGITPQTKGNALRPYGMVYDMLQNLRVPVKWVISTTKAKDDVDFEYNGTTYRGSSFIILAQYRTTEVNVAISSWVKGGVIGVNTSSPLSLEVYATLSYAPKWALDKDKGTLIKPIFENAGIPASAYGGALVSDGKTPKDLSECDDIFVLPHADPTALTHGNLLAWNRDHKGAIWVGCHAVSEFENIGLNFLTTAGMVKYTDHKPGTPAYTYSNSSQPVMQFMGRLDLASNTGSEGIYFPKTGSKWNAGTTLSITDTDHSQLNTISQGPAAVVAYGNGFNDLNRGLVMYQGGHFYDGGNEVNNVPVTEPVFGQDHIALQRAFLNFSLFVASDRQKNTVNAQVVTSPVMGAGESNPVKFTLPAGTDISKYQINWSSSSGTILPNSTSRDIIFTPSVAQNVKIALITLVLTDACGRQYFTTFNININQCNFPAFTPDITLPGVLADGQIHDLSFTAPANINLDLYKPQWSVSSGRIIGSDSTSTVRYLPPYTPSVNEVTLSLTLTDECGNTVTQSEVVSIDHILKNNGEISASKLVSINNDGLGHDYLHLDNIELYAENELTIYNRWGNIIFHAKGYDNNNVKFTGLNLASRAVTEGVFYYVLKINSPTVPAASVLTKGYFILKK